MGNVYQTQTQLGVRWYDIVAPGKGCNSICKVHSEPDKIPMLDVDMIRQFWRFNLL